MRFAKGQPAHIEPFSITLANITTDDTGEKQAHRLVAQGAILCTGEFVRVYAHQSEQFDIETGLLTYLTQGCHLDGLVGILSALREAPVVWLTECPTHQQNLNLIIWR